MLADDSRCLGVRYMAHGHHFRTGRLFACLPAQRGQQPVCVAGDIGYVRRFQTLVEPSCGVADTDTHRNGEDYKDHISRQALLRVVYPSVCGVYECGLCAACLYYASAVGDVCAAVCGNVHPHSRAVYDYSSHTCPALVRVGREMNGAHTARFLSGIQQAIDSLTEKYLFSNIRWFLCVSKVFVDFRGDNGFHNVVSCCGGMYAIVGVCFG